MLTPIIVVFLIKAPMKRTIQNPIAAMVEIIKNASPTPEFKFGLLIDNGILTSVDMKSKIEMNIVPVRRSTQQQQFVNLHMFAQ